MITAAIAELKARLSAYLKKLKAGHEILITDRGLPVAKLVPLERKVLRNSRRARLASAGLLRLGRGRARKSLLSPPGGKLGGKSVLAALLEEREEGR
jgi:prevent-host-death family protein